MDCLFCKIIAGEIPSYKLYEDDLIYVMLDRYPSARGHSLILPKRHSADVYDLTDEECSRIFVTSKKVALSLRESLDFEGLNLLQNNGKAAGQAINHFHLHLIPRFKGDGIKIKGETTDPSPEELEAVLKEIKAVL